MTKCRLCGETDLQPVLNLGDVPLSNSFLTLPNEVEERYPLELVFCPDCSLCQITETVPPAKLFSQYNYFSSISRDMLAHAKDLVTQVIADHHLNKDSRVIELASNDGYLLQYFQQAGVPNVLGIDPAQNIAALANQKGVPTLCEFFGDKVAETVEPADVILALNVLGHVPNLSDFACGIRKALKPNGVAVIEVPYVRDMIESLALDTIYFEHCFYYSLSSLVQLFKRNALQVVKAERIPIHCGSLRIHVTHPNPFAPPDKHGLDKLLRQEHNLGIDRMEYYRSFAGRAQSLKRELRELLCFLKSNGNQIIGYGAAAKGVQMLNFLDAKSDLIEYVVDSTPAKIGKYIPGTHQKIVSPTDMGKPDVIVVLAWNWVKEIVGKHPDFKGKWLTLLPRIEFL